MDNIFLYVVANGVGDVHPDGYARRADAEYACRELLEEFPGEGWRVVSVLTVGTAKRNEVEEDKEDRPFSFRSPAPTESLKTLVDRAWDTWESQYGCDGG